MPLRCRDVIGVKTVPYAIPAAWQDRKTGDATCGTAAVNWRRVERQRAAASARGRRAKITTGRPVYNQAARQRGAATRKRRQRSKA